MRKFSSNTPQGYDVVDIHCVMVNAIDATNAIKLHYASLSIMSLIPIDQNKG